MPHTPDHDDDSSVKDALKRDLEQTKADMPGMEGQEIDQDVDDTLKQATGKEPVPPKGMPNVD